jgi:hypothetical protein
LVTRTHYRYFRFGSLWYQLIGFATFSIYQRTVLFIVSAFSTVNLNFVLCMSPADPFAKRFGSWYYIFGEFYLNLASYLTKFVLIFVGTNLKALVTLYEAYVYSKGFRKEKISQSQFKKML